MKWFTVDILAQENALLLKINTLEMLAIENDWHWKCHMAFEMLCNKNEWHLECDCQWKNTPDIWNIYNGNDNKNAQRKMP